MLDVLKSHRPRRRKHAAQLARPAIGDGSACQPNTARVSAEASIGAWGERVVGGVPVSDDGLGEMMKAVA